MTSTPSTEGRTTLTASSTRRAQRTAATIPTPPSEQAVQEHLARLRRSRDAAWERLRSHV